MAIEILRVRSAADFRRLHELFIEYEADLRPELRHGTVPKIPDLRAEYERENAAFLALSDGDAIGCVAVRELDPDTALLMRLFVRHRSRGLGAARGLAAAVIAFAQAGAYRRVVLDTNKEHLVAAYRLYRSLGFEECEPFATVTYECPTFMELLLSA